MDIIMNESIRGTAYGRCFGDKFRKADEDGLDTTKVETVLMLVKGKMTTKVEVHGCSEGQEDAEDQIRQKTMISYSNNLKKQPKSWENDSRNV